MADPCRSRFRSICVSASSPRRSTVAEARRTWAAAAPALRPEDLVFVDERGGATSISRLYGPAPSGQRANGAVPHGRWERLTMLGGLALDGLVAYLAVEGPTKTAVMIAFTKHVPLPALRPGQTVILDNLSVHRAGRVRRLIEAAGCRLLFLPPYSPDFNPIEQAWSKLKTLLRGMGARTAEALHTALSVLVDRITGSNARGYCPHCGYAAH